jgi:anti-sigma B factor antagonist
MSWNPVRHHAHPGGSGAGGGLSHRVGPGETSGLVIDFKAPMIVQKRHLDGFTLLNVEGVIKLGESAQFFAQTLERTLSDDLGHVIIDFSKINFIDSTGIGELVGYLGRFRNSKRELILVNPSERIRKLLQVARLDTLFPTYDSVEAAIDAER